MLKKAFISALTTVLTTSSFGTIFANANPFSDVPANNWAYKAVEKLHNDGVINGYPDGEFKGNNQMTRYEMAQIIAKAMTYENLTKADKQIVDKLAREYSQELDNLGVRVSNLENKADKIRFTGYAQYSYLGEKNPILKKGKTLADSNYQGESQTPTNRYQFRLYAKGDIGNGWTANTRMCYYINANESNNDYDATVNRMYISKNYGNTLVELGRMGNWSDYVVGTGFVLNGGFFSGGLIQRDFGKDKAFKFTLAGGRMQFDSSLNNSVDKNNHLNHFLDGTGNGLQVELGWAKPNGKLSANLGYYHFSDFAGPCNNNCVGDIWSSSQVSSIAQKNKNYTSDTVTPYTYTKNDVTLANKNNIWAASLGYKFDKNLKLIAGYAKSDLKANKDYLGDLENKAYTIALVYKADSVLDTDKTKVGSWNAYLGYAYQGDAVAKYGAGLYEIAGANMKGFEVGMSYVPSYNVEWILSYFTGKQLDIDYGNNDADIKGIYTELDFFF